MHSRARIARWLLPVALLTAAAPALAQTPLLPPIPRPRPATFAPASASAPATAPAPAVFDRASALNAINRYFNAVETLQGDYFQIDSTGAITTGRLYMAKPGLIRFEAPGWLMVSNGSSLQFINEVARSQHYMDLNRTPLRVLVQTNVDLTSEDMVGNVTLLPDLIRVSIQQRFLGEGALQLFFDRTTFELKQWEMTDIGGTTATVVLDNVVVNQPVAASLFVVQERRF